MDEDGRADAAIARPVGPETERELSTRYQMLDGEPIEDWIEPEYRLERGGFDDYPVEVRGYRLCSDRLRRVIDATKAPADPLEWLPARVVGIEGETRPYWVLHIRRHPVTLLPGLEDLDWGTLRRAADDGALAEYRVLPPPGAGLLTFLVDDAVREAILDAGCEVAFRPL